MTDDEINEAITEATGLWDYPYSSETKRMYDFCSDLNAMHEVEKTLSETNMFVMAHWIEQIVNRNGGHYFHATARQRAEAFLRTLGKWRATDKDSLTVGGATTEESSVDHLRDATKMTKEVQK